MALTRTLGSTLDATTNGDPNSLGTKRPYTASQAQTYQDNLARLVSAAWTSQAKKALFPIGTRDGGGDVPIKCHLIPSSGAAVTWTVVVWMYNAVSDSWAKPVVGASQNGTGEGIFYIDGAGYDAIWIQISTISAGTATIYFDGANAIAA